MTAFRSCRRAPSESAAQSRWRSGAPTAASSGGRCTSSRRGPGKVIGRLRSCGYGFTARRNLAYSYLPIDLKPGGSVEVEVFGQMAPAAVTTDAVVQREHVQG